MAQNHIELIGTILLFLFGVTMIYQGHLIFHGKRGYKHSEREQHHLARMRERVEKLMGETKDE